MDNNKDIKVRWCRVPSQPLRSSSFFIHAKENELFLLLNKMGVVSGGQVAVHQILHNNPKRTRQILKGLVANRKIMEHTLLEVNSEKKKEYKIYTLGPEGAKAINIPYQSDYWYNYNTSEVIERVMTLEFYLKFKDFIGSDIKVEQLSQPYLYRFSQSDKHYLIGVTWDNALDFLEEYRWNNPDERVILLCQHINQLDCLLGVLKEDTPIRAVPKDKIKGDLVFFRPHNGRWVLDSPQDTPTIIKRPVKQLAEQSNDEKQKIIRRKQIIL